MKNQTQVVVTGLAWMGSGIGSIESAIERIFGEAEHEILITSYSISNASDHILDWLETSLAHGVLIRLIINKIGNQPAAIVDRLVNFSNSYSHFYLYTFEGDEEQDLHAKVIVTDRKLGIVGSSNLSRRGLLTNHELAILVEGKAAEQIAAAIDRLLVSEFIKRYPL